MRLETLWYFLKAADMHSITAAANELYLSPQGLSKAILQLERELGTTLFYRNGNEITLTRSGIEVYQTAKEMLLLNEQMTSRILNISQEDTADSLKILATRQITATFLPKVLNRFFKRKLRADVTVQEEIPENMLEKLRLQDSGEDSIVLISLPYSDLEMMMQDKPENVTFTELASCEMLCCVSTGSPLAEKQSVSINDFSSMPLVEFNLDTKLLRGKISDFSGLHVMLSSTNVLLCRSILAEKPSGGWIHKSCNGKIPEGQPSLYCSGLSKNRNCIWILSPGQR